MKKINEYAIRAKFSEYVLCPSEAIDKGFWQDQTYHKALRTIDGVKAFPIFIGSCDNSRGDYDDVLNDVCMERFGCPFSSVKSIWISRIDNVGPYWHFIRLEALDAQN